MNEEDVYVQTFTNFGTHLKELFSSIHGGLLLTVSTFIALSDTAKGLLTLVIICVFDLITGCLASWIEHKKDPTPIKVYFIESAKLRKSFIKMVTYSAIIFFAWTFTELFFDQAIPVPFSTKELFLVNLALGGCIAVECFSNIENLKRAGFDLFGAITSISKNVWKLVHVVKTGKND